MRTPGFHRELRDGRPIEIRPIAPNDRQLLLEAFARLSPESRYRRFFGPMPELRDRELDYLTQVDHSDHEALVAVDSESGQIVGVARFIRLEAGGDAAELAITVVDDWQRRGVGSALLEALAQRARDEGIRRFEAPVLANNADAIRVLEALGETTYRHEGHEVVLSIELPLAEVPRARWRALMQQFALSAIEPGRSVIGRVWPRRSGSPHDQRANLIVVGIDGSQSSREALAVASELARSSGARIHLIGVTRRLSADARDLRQLVTETAGELRAQGVDTTAEVRTGDAALVLTDAAFEREARLIVVGAGERGKAARRLIGSVADYVAERAPCNVLIVRPRS